MGGRKIRRSDDCGQGLTGSKMRDSRVDWTQENIGGGESYFTRKQKNIYPNLYFPNSSDSNLHTIVLAPKRLTT